MRRCGLPRFLALSGFAISAFSCFSALAQDTRRVDPKTAAEMLGRVDEQELVTAEFKKTSIREILDWIAQRVGKRIDLDDGVEDKISVRFEELPYLQAVKLASDLARCVVEEKRDLVIVSKPPRRPIDTPSRSDPRRKTRLPPRRRRPF